MSSPRTYGCSIRGDNDEMGSPTRQDGKIYSTSRKLFTSMSSESRSEIMQPLSNKCQSNVQLGCHKPKQSFGKSLTRKKNDCYGSSFYETQKPKTQFVPPTNSSLTNLNMASSLGIFQPHTAYNPYKDKNFHNQTDDIQDILTRKEIKRRVKYNSRNTIRNKLLELATVVNSQRSLVRSKHTTLSTTTSASNVGFRVKRLRTSSPATAATATTTAWVNTLLMSWLIVQELFLVCPPCDARSTTVINAGNPDAKRLYDDLLSNYNKLVRPVVNTTDALQVMIKLKLSQLIDVVSVKSFLFSFPIYFKIISDIINVIYCVKNDIMW